MIEIKCFSQYSFEQITRNQEQFHLFNNPTSSDSYSFAPVKPTERWLHRTTAVKIRVGNIFIFQAIFKLKCLIEFSTKSSRK